MFIGRKKEMAILNELYESRKSELLVIYGRRRIGKSSLIEHFIETKPFKIKFEGIENSSKQKQIDYFVNIIEKVYKDKFIKHMKFTKWELVLDYFTEKIVLNQNREEKLVLFFDEIQWISSNRSTFISLLKYYWDNYWKKNNVMVILCGSIASFMIKKVIKSKALYGRNSKIYAYFWRST